MCIQVLSYYFTLIVAALNMVHKAMVANARYI